VTSAVGTGAPFREGGALPVIVAVGRTEGIGSAIRADTIVQVAARTIGAVIIVLTALAHASRRIAHVTGRTKGSASQWRRATLAEGIGERKAAGEREVRIAAVARKPACVVAVARIPAAHAGLASGRGERAARPVGQRVAITAACVPMCLPAGVARASAYGARRGALVEWIREWKAAGERQIGIAAVSGEPAVVVGAGGIPSTHARLTGDRVHGAVFKVRHGVAIAAA
jgi:hypothetical protein